MAVIFRLNDYGIDLRGRIVQDGVAQDISAFDTLQLILRHTRTGTTKTRDAEFLTDGTDGYIHYTLVAGDLNYTGEWQARARVINDDADLRSEWVEFTVTA